jgi:hypothetical protein
MLKRKNLMSDVLYGRSAKATARYQTSARLQGASLLDDLDDFLVFTSWDAFLEDVGKKRYIIHETRLEDVVPFV